MKRKQEHQTAAVALNDENKEKEWGLDGMFKVPALPLPLFLRTQTETETNTKPITSITSPLTLTMARYETKHPKPKIMMTLNGPETGNVSTADMLQRELKRRHDKVLGWDGRTLSYPHPRSDQSPPRDSYTDAGGRFNLPSCTSRDG